MLTPTMTMLPRRGRLQGPLSDPNKGTATMSSRPADHVGLRASCALIVLLLALDSPVPAADAYYLLMFGSQRIPNEPSHSHSFATFVRAEWVGPAMPRLEVQTIS